MTGRDPKVLQIACGKRWRMAKEKETSRRSHRSHNVANSMQTDRLRSQNVANGMWKEMENGKREGDKPKEP